MRDAYLGIDLGTSSVKAVAIDSTARVIATAQERYAVDRPCPGWAEQDPELWWRSAVLAIRRLLDGNELRVCSIGLSGQMHTLVLLDGELQAARPAIVWSDTRALTETEAWRRSVGDALVRRTTGFPISTGMLGVSLQWVRDHEPEVYTSASVAFSPKDYLRFRLTGVVATEPTDAGATLLYDIHRAEPALDIIDAVGLRRDLLPPVVPSLRVAGELTRAAADELGLDRGTPVAAGGGDQAMAALALGLTDPTRAAVAISSGGTLVKPTRGPLNPDAGLHVLPHAVAGSWLAMGVLLSAGLGMDWLADRVFGRRAGGVERLLREAEGVAPGADGIRFSADLAGVRTPVVDAGRRGSIVGLGLDHGQAHIARAMVEGVCIQFGTSLTAMLEAGETVRDLVITGGGSRSRLWRQTLSDVTGLPVHASTDADHSALGAAFAGALSTGEHIDIDYADLIRETTYPDPAHVALYRDVAAELRQIERALARGKEKSA